jgi:hypothetical protein
MTYRKACINDRTTVGNEHDFTIPSDKEKNNEVAAFSESPVLENSKEEPDTRRLPVLPQEGWMKTSIGNRTEPIVVFEQDSFSASQAKEESKPELLSKPKPKKRLGVFRG